jgi:hypothetical protein
MSHFTPFNRSSLQVAASWRMAGLVVTVMCAAALFSQSDASAQRGGGGGRGGGPPRPARDLAPIDLTGTWVSVVTEDWRWRMVTPPEPRAGRGGALTADAASIPLSGEGSKVAAAWSLEADNKAGNQCKAFGVGGIMRQPGRVRISWQDNDTLKMEFDAGTQTRLMQFSQAVKPPAEKTWQGHSFAVWEGPGVGRGAPAGDGRADPRVTGGGLLGRDVPGGGGSGLRGGPPPRQQAQLNTGGDLKVVTTNFKEGYLRKNGIPYSEQATITEYFHRLPTHPNGDNWMVVLTTIEDPRYLSQPFYTSSNFRLEANDTAFSPAPCQTAPPLPVTKK